MLSAGRVGQQRDALLAGLAGEDHASFPALLGVVLGGCMVGSWPHLGPAVGVAMHDAIDGVEPFLVEHAAMLLEAGIPHLANRQHPGQEDGQSRDDEQDTDEQPVRAARLEHQPVAALLGGLASALVS